MITTIVVPCHDEARRLDGDAFLALLDDPALRLVFVDDGSTDGTAACLSAIASRRPGQVEVASLSPNRGKAEAVRHGLLRALARGADAVGYLDADLATPIREIRRLVGVLRESHLDVVLASRVALLGRHIQRRAVRHYLGRVFATGASLVLDLVVYDTQCGAKVFRRTPALEAALADPFLSRWIFDVELLGRLVTGTPAAPGLPLASIREEPLEAWRDVPGSKLRARQMLGAARDLAVVRADLAARARAVAARRAASG